MVWGVRKFYTVDQKENVDHMAKMRAAKAAKAKKEAQASTQETEFGEIDQSNMDAAIENLTQIPQNKKKEDGISKEDSTD